MIAFLSSIGFRVVAIVTIIGAVWAHGFISGRNAGQIEQLQDTVEAFQERNAIDENTSQRSDFGLCVDLGGMPDQCDELRRLDKAAGSE